MLTLYPPTLFSQVLYIIVESECSFQHRFIADTGSCEWSISKNFLDMIRPNILPNPTNVLIKDAADHRLKLRDEMIYQVRFKVRTLPHSISDLN